MKLSILVVVVGTDRRIGGEIHGRSGRDIGVISDDLQICLTRFC